MIPLNYIRHPYTPACQEAGHKRSSTGLACVTCRNQANQDSRRARGKMPPLMYPYTPACQEAGHIPIRGGRACATCRTKGNLAQRMPPAPPAPAPPSNGNGHSPDTTAWIEWGQEIVDALILQSHAVSPDRDPLRPGYVQRLIDRRPRCA